MSKILIELKNINKTFNINNDNNIYQVLNNINLTVFENEWIGIVGESGSGKSTIAKIIVLFEKQDSGEIIFMNNKLELTSTNEQKDYYRKVQMVFQNPLSSFSPRMTIGTYLLEAFINYNICSKVQAHKEIQQILKKVKLKESCMHKFPHELSGGELQRIVISRVLLMKPSLIIFDEATSALDVTIQKDIINLLLELKNNIKFSAIIISHNIALVKKVTSRMYVLYKGQIVEEFNSSELLQNIRKPYTKTLTKSIFNIKMN